MTLLGARTLNEGSGTRLLQPEASGGIAFCGDSLTNFWYPYAEMWHNALCSQSGGYLRHRGKFALGGQTLEQIESIYLPAALALSPQPQAIVLAGGTNNHSAAGYTLASSAATLNRMINRVRGAGILPVLWLVPPRQDSVTYNTRASQWNVYVRYLAASQGLPFIDFHTPLVDPATGLTAAAFIGDTVHPNYVGHQTAAAYNLARPNFLAPFADQTPHLVHDTVDPTNLIGASPGLFGAMSGSYPTGFNGFGTMTCSLVTDSSAVGNWVRITRTSGATGSAGLSPTTSPTVTPGDKIAFACRYRHAYVMPSNTAQAGVQLTIQALDAGNATLATTYAYGPLFGTSTGVAYTEAVMPPNTAKVKTEARITGTTSADSTADFAQWTVLNLTALGAADLTTTAYL